MFKTPGVIGVLGVLGVAALVAAPVASGAFPTSAPRAHPAGIAVVVVGGPRTAKVPSISILGTGVGAHYKPDSVTAGLSPSSEACTGSDESMSVVNKSSLDEDMIEGTSDFVNLPPGSSAAVCLYANGSSSFAFELANAHVGNTLQVAVG
jgi:hypothetical protein